MGRGAGGARRGAARPALGRPPSSSRTRPGAAQGAAQQVRDPAERPVVRVAHTRVGAPEHGSGVALGRSGRTDRRDEIVPVHRSVRERRSVRRRDTGGQLAAELLDLLVKAARKAGRAGRPRPAGDLRPASAGPAGHAEGLPGPRRPRGSAPNPGPPQRCRRGSPRRAPQGLPASPDGLRLPDEEIPLPAWCVLAPKHGGMPSVPGPIPQARGSNRCKDRRCHAGRPRHER